MAGDGDGMIVQRGFQPPPSYHIDRLRQAPVGHFFSVITNGFGAMYPYGYRMLPRDRWAIIAYIRALQLSRQATIDDVPEAERSKLLRRSAMNVDGNIAPNLGRLPARYALLGAVLLAFGLIAGHWRFERLFTART